MKYFFFFALLFATYYNVQGQNTCTSQCSGSLGPNIFPDGDFGTGTANILTTNPQIAPGYGYQLNPPPNDGFYVITNNTTNWGNFANPNWINIPDNGPEPNGYMMVVNASISPGLFYEKQVDVCENTLYEMSVDLISMVSPSVAAQNLKSNVAFLIDGAVVCETGDIPHDAQWRTYRFSFTTSVGTNSVNLAFRNNALGGMGNDLAIDNISFRACGPNFILNDTSYYCTDSSLYLHADIIGSPYTTPVYQWQYSQNGATWTDISGATSTDWTVTGTDKSGFFRLLSANSLNNISLPNCRTISQITQGTIEDLSGFQIGGTDTTVCNGVPAYLSAGIFSEYEWSNQTFGSQIEVLDAGGYTVTVTTENGCTTTDSIYVEEAAIMASLAQEDVRCFGENTGSVTIENVIGTGLVEFTLDPTAFGINPVFEALNVGDYTAYIRDEKGCTLELPFSIEEPPPLAIDLDSTLLAPACEQITIESTTNAINPNYLWSSPANLSCENCPNPSVFSEQDAWINVILWDAAGCSTQDSVFLDVQPIVDLYAPTVFTPASSDLNTRFQLFPSKSALQYTRFAIYDRWGSLILYRENVLPDSDAALWEGFLDSGKKAAAGVYVWFVEVDFGEGILEKYSGDVLLVR